MPEIFTSEERDFFLLSGAEMTQTRTYRHESQEIADFSIVADSSSETIESRIDSLARCEYASP